MTHFLWLRTLCVTTFTTAYGKPLPIPEYTRSYRIYVLHNVLNRNAFTPYFHANPWIWDVRGDV
jgi:hypothetical protein